MKRREKKTKGNESCCRRNQSPLSSVEKDIPMFGESDEIDQLFRVRRTVLEMLRDRDYFVADFEVNMTKRQFIDRFGEELKRDDLVINKAKRSDCSDRILVFFPEEPTINVKVMEKYVKRMTSQNISRAIFVVQKKLTSQLSIKLQEEGFKNLHLEIFKEPELLFNVVQHVLVPKHEVISNEMKEALLTVYNVNEKQLSRIQMADPVARYYGLIRGQVVKIIRPSGTAGRHVTYRICI